MMNKEQQVEKIINFLMSLDTYDHEECDSCRKWQHNACDDECFSRKVAEDFFDAGFGVQSVIVLGILNEIRGSLDFHKEFCNYNIGTGYGWAMSEVQKVLWEIERKYSGNKE